MVTINFTLLIEVGLFLLFLWGTARFILRPVLLTLDERETTLVENEERASEDSAAADNLEGEFAEKIVQLHCGAEEVYRDSRRELMNAHIERLSAERERSDEAVALAREEASRIIEQERPALEEAVPELVHLIAKRLESEGGPA